MPTETPILISMHVVPAAMEARLKVLRMLGLLNDEAGLHDTIKMCEYMLEAAAIKEAEEAANKNSYQSKIQELERYRYDAQKQMASASNMWTSSTTSTTTPYIKGTKDANDPFTFPELHGKFDPPF